MVRNAAEAAAQKSWLEHHAPQLLIADVVPPLHKAYTYCQQL